KKYTENQILPKLASLKGVNQVNVYGAAPFEWVIEYDSNKLIQLNLTINDIEVAINDYLNDLELGSGTLSSKQNEATHEISIVLTQNMEDEVNWNKIPIKKVNHRIVYLENIATVKYKEGKVNAYYRINGLNTINMVVYAEKGVNTIELAKEVKATIEQIRQNLSNGYSIKLTQDTTEYVVGELQKIKTRTLFSFLILLVLIVIINRSFRYLIILFLSI